MTKEQEIYKNMRRRGNIKKCYGQWCISYAALYCAIKDAGYKDDHTIWAIMENMLAAGWIRKSKDSWGRESEGLGHRFIIVKWPPRPDGD